MHARAAWVVASAVIALECPAAAEPGHAPTDEIRACVTASDEAQRLRDERKLLGARDHLLVCVREKCPEIVRTACAKWLSDVEASLPSVTLSARDARGRDVAHVRVSLDGAFFTDTLDGKAIFIDPGPHSFSFEVPGRPPVEQSITAREGERNRAVAVVLGVEPDAAGSTTAPSRDVSSAPVTGYLVMGGGAVALAAATFFWISGKSDVRTLRDGCGASHPPTCAQADVDAAQRKLIVGDITAGAGLVAIGVGAYMILSRTGAPPAAKSSALGSPRVGITVLPGGGAATFVATF